MKRTGWRILLLALAAAVAAACGRGESPGSAGFQPASGGQLEAGAPTDGGALLGDGGALADDHHGAGTMRCSHCHSAEDKKNPKWRDTAKRLGHDLKRVLAERSTCKCCHIGEVKDFGDPIGRRCVECHDDIRVTITGMGTMHCLSCHDLAGGDTTILETAWECKKCHGDAQGDKAAIHVHATVSCSNCHRPHQEPWTVPRLCSDCHAGQKTWHTTGSAADAGAPGAQHAMTGEPMACATCHKPHEAAGAASSRCFTCHASHEPGKFTAASTFPGGHERCTTCHTPHGDGAKSGPRSCRSCHTTLATMNGPASEAHSRCVSCHQPHDVMGSPRTACAGCHASVHSDHPDPKGVGCTGCHEVHPGGPSRAVMSTSMLATLPETAYPKASSPVTCSRCHTKATSDLAFHDGKTACETCHKPHAFTSPTCSTCHARETAAAVASAGRGHVACKGCHEPHAPLAPKPACDSCHTEEARTAPAGHAKCTSCHDAHPTSRTPKAQCTTCHAERTKGPHAPVACANCHRPHGPDAPAGPPGAASIPACLSCHTPSKLLALHAAKSHATCTSCHTSHGPPRSDRATCLACHADKKEHEPTATMCVGCHPFGKGKYAPRP